MPTIDYEDCHRLLDRYAKFKDDKKVINRSGTERDYAMLTANDFLLETYPDRTWKVESVCVQKHKTVTVTESFGMEQVARNAYCLLEAENYELRLISPDGKTVLTNRAE